MFQRPSISNKRMNSKNGVESYLRKIMKAQSNKLTITWARSIAPKKWSIIQKLNTSKPTVSSGEEEGKDSGITKTRGELKNYQKGSFKGRISTTQQLLLKNAQTKKMTSATTTNTKPLIEKTIPTTEDESDIPITKQLEDLCRIRTTEAERMARVQERLENIRIEKKIKEHEKRMKEEKLRKEMEALEAASNLVRPLTDEEKLIVDNAIHGKGSDAEIVAKAENDSVQRKSMRTLRKGCWLNDEVIHYFYLMLSRRNEQTCKSEGKRRSHFFKSFFLTKLFDEGASNQYRYQNVKRWSKRVPGKDIFELDKIFFPCNVSNTHWCCAVIFVQEKRVQFYDSMHGHGMYYLKGLMQYLKDEWSAKKGGELPDADKWTLVPCETTVPCQENGYDCGVFTCMFADFLSFDRQLTFSQEHITQCRERIALSIMKGVAIE